MTAHEWLSQYLEIQEDIWSMENELEAAYARVTGITAKPSGAGGGSGVDRKFDRYEQTKEAYNQQIDKLVNMQLEIRKAIENLTNGNYRAVLRYAYICGYSNNTISELMNLDRHTVTRWKSRALEQIAVPKN
jgi:DNA-directed RNA polymerase specialized sigma24 family protein